MNTDHASMDPPAYHCTKTMDLCVIVSLDTMESSATRKVHERLLLQYNAMQCSDLSIVNNLVVIFNA